MRFNANQSFVNNAFLHLQDNPGDLGFLQMQLKKLQETASEKAVAAACIGKKFTTVGVQGCHHGLGRPRV